MTNELTNAAAPQTPEANTSSDLQEGRVSVLNEGFKPGSVLAQVKELRAGLRKDRHLDLTIPNTGGKLVARYKPLGYETLRNLKEKADKQPTPAKQELTLACDALINACDVICYRDAEGNLEPLNISGNPVRFNRVLANELGIENPDSDRPITARETLLAVFGEDMRVALQFAQYQEWVGLEEEQVEIELAGKSEGTDS